MIAESESSHNSTASGNISQAEQGRAWPHWVPTALPQKLTSSRFLGAVWGSTAVQSDSPGGDAALGPRQHFAQTEASSEGGSAAPHAEARDNGEVDAATPVSSSQPWWNRTTQSGHEGRRSEEVARQQDDASVSNVRPALASRVSGAVSSVARRFPGWGAAPREQGSAESSGPGIEQQVEEGDDAVDALMDGPASAQGSSAAGPEEEGRSSWLQRLGRLQALASYAASGVRNAGQLLPTFVHFGRSMTWDMVCFAGLTGIPDWSISTLVIMLAELKVQT